MGNCHPGHIWNFTNVNFYTDVSKPNGQVGLGVVSVRKGLPTTAALGTHRDLSDIGSRGMPKMWYLGHSWN